MDNLGFEEYKPTRIREIVGISVMLALLAGAATSLSLNIMLFIGFVGVIAVLLLS
jgi:hypothetical protein